MVREIALHLSRADTYTPVSYWMELPLIELNDWTESVIKVSQKKPKK